MTNLPFLVLFLVLYIFCFRLVYQYGENLHLKENRRPIVGFFITGRHALPHTKDLGQMQVSFPDPSSILLQVEILKTAETIQ